MSNPSKELSAVILDFLKDNPEASSMAFEDFYEAIQKLSNCQTEAFSAVFSGTVLIMSLKDEIVITRGEEGGNLRFSLPVTTA